MARASPMARRAVELAVGARPMGQASLSTPTSMMMSLCFARVDVLFPVKAIVVHPIFRILGMSEFNSSVSPLFV